MLHLLVNSNALWVNVEYQVKLGQNMGGADMNCPNYPLKGYFVFLLVLHREYCSSVVIIVVESHRYMKNQSEPATFLEETRESRG